MAVMVIVLTVLILLMPGVVSVMAMIDITRANMHCSG